jgi:hypothetical protein
LVEAFDCVQSQALAVEPELLQHTGWNFQIGLNHIYVQETVGST